MSRSAVPQGCEGCKSRPPSAPPTLPGLMSLVHACTCIPAGSLAPFPRASSSSTLSSAGKGETLAVFRFSFRNVTHSFTVSVERGREVGETAVRLSRFLLPPPPPSSSSLPLSAASFSSLSSVDDICLCSHLRCVESALLAWSNVSTTLSLLSPLCDMDVTSEGKGSSETICRPRQLRFAGANSAGCNQIRPL